VTMKKYPLILAALLMALHPLSVSFAEDSSAKKYLRLYQEKDPFRAVVYSMVIPGAGNMYCGNPVNTAISWAVITGTVLYANTTPITNENKGLVLVYGISAGYLYGMLTSYMDAVNFNRRLREEAVTNKFSATLAVLPAGAGNFRLCGSLRYSF